MEKNQIIPLAAENFGGIFNDSGEVADQTLKTSGELGFSPETQPIPEKSDLFKTSQELGFSPEQISKPNLGWYVAETLKGAGKDVWDFLTGVSEAGVATASGIPAYILGYLGQGAHALFDIWKTGGRGIAGPKELIEKFGEKAPTKEKIAQFFTYQPTTKEGAEFAKIPVAPFEAAFAGIDKLAQAITDDEDIQQGIRFLADTLLIFGTPVAKAKIKSAIASRRPLRASEFRSMVDKSAIPPELMDETQRYLAKLEEMEKTSARRPEEIQTWAEMPRIPKEQSMVDKSAIPPEVADEIQRYLAKLEGMEKTSARRPEEIQTWAEIPRIPKEQPLVGPIATPIPQKPPVIAPTKKAGFAVTPGGVAIRQPETARGIIQQYREMEKPLPEPQTAIILDAKPNPDNSWRIELKIPRVEERPAVEIRKPGEIEARPEIPETKKIERIAEPEVKSEITEKPIIEEKPSPIEKPKEIKPEPELKETKTPTGLEELQDVLDKLNIKMVKRGALIDEFLTSYDPKKGSIEEFVKGRLRFIDEEGNIKGRHIKEVPLEEKEIATGESAEEAYLKKIETERDAAIEETIRDVLSELPEQDRKIAEGIAEGRSLREDAKALGLSYETIRKKRTQILEELRKNESIQKLRRFDDVVETLSRQKQAEEPAIGLSIKQIKPPARKIPEYKFENPEIEEAYRSAIKPKENTLSYIKAKLNHIKNIWTRTYENLPNKPEFERAIYALKRLEKQRPIAFDKTVQALDVIAPKDKELYSRFSRKVLLEDFNEEISRGAAKLPFGFDKDTVVNELGRINAELSKYPELMESWQKRQAVRKALVDSYAEAMKRIGIDVEEKLRRENYFPHFVLKYAEAKARIKGTGQKLKAPLGRGFLKQRLKGEEASTLPINVDYLEAEGEVMSQMIYDMEIAKTLNRINADYGIADRLIAEAKAKGLSSQDAFLDENIPKGYKIFRPREGNIFYLGKTITERAVENILEKGIQALWDEDFKLREAILVGPKRKPWVLPEEIVDTLETFVKRKESNIFANLDRKGIIAWKKAVVGLPTRVFKFFVRNISGDAEHTFLGNPRAFKRVPQAIVELYNVFIRKRPMSERMKEFFEEGGIQSTLVEQEMKKLGQFESIYGNPVNWKNLPQETFKRYWNAVRIANSLRESILRYANYLEYYAQMEASPEGRPLNFGASNREAVMSLPTIKERAFKLQNELIGAYDRITEAGQKLREYWYPFWSWTEVNPKIYFGLVRNAILDRKTSALIGKSIVAVPPVMALRLGRLALKFGAVYAAISAWNHYFHGEEEDALSEDVKNTEHIVLGKDSKGEINYFSRIGSFGDLMEWVGGVDNLTQFLSSKKPFKEFIEEVGKGTVNKVVQGLNPILKTAVELYTRETMFPDVFDPKPIRDQTLYLFRQIALGNEYMEIAGIPTKPYKEKVVEYFIYKSDPYESAYYEILEKKRDWLKDKGKYNYSINFSPKANALYYLKQAHRYGDKESEKKFLDEYISYVILESGTTLNSIELKKKIKESILTSYKNMHPLHGIKKEDQKEFIASLDESMKRKLGRALQFYSEVLIGPNKINVKEILENIDVSRD